MFRARSWFLSGKHGLPPPPPSTCLDPRWDLTSRVFFCRALCPVYTTEKTSLSRGRPDTVYATAPGGGGGGDLRSAGKRHSSFWLTLQVAR